MLSHLNVTMVFWGPSSTCVAVESGSGEAGLAGESAFCFTGHRILQMCPFWLESSGVQTLIRAVQRKLHLTFEVNVFSILFWVMVGGGAELLGRKRTGLFRLFQFGGLTAFGGTIMLSRGGGTRGAGRLEEELGQLRGLFQLL